MVRFDNTVEGRNFEVSREVANASSPWLQKQACRDLQTKTLTPYHLICLGSILGHINKTDISSNAYWVM